MSQTNNFGLNERLGRLSPQRRAQLALRLSKTERKDRPEKEVALPKAQPDPLHRFEPFPLSDIQQAYLIGRQEGVELGNVGCHNYFEVDIANWDSERFENALNKLICRHEMLRGIILPEGRQQILNEVPRYHVKCTDLRGQSPSDLEAHIETVRTKMAQYIHPTDVWPLFEFRATQIDAGCARLHIGFDLLIADGRSFEIIFDELATLYRDPNAQLPLLELSFRDYLLAFNRLADTDAFRASRDYWSKRVVNLPAAPELPFAVNPASIVKPLFKRRRWRLDRASWKSLKDRTARAGLTPAVILMAAYAEVVAIWSKSQHFTLNLTLFNRLPLHGQANKIVGDFTSVDLLEVNNAQPDPFESRARRSQEQLWQDIDYRYFSGVRVIRELTRLQGVGPKAIMPVVFTSLLNLGNRSEEATWASRLGNTVYTVGQTPQVCLDCMVQESAGELLVNWDAIDELFPAELLDNMFEAYQRLIEDLCADDSAWYRSVAENARRLIPAAQIVLREAANATAAPLTEDLLHTPFLQQVAKRPEQPAVVTPRRKLTYRELYQRACCVEQELLRCGVKPNELVAVMMEKGWEQIVGVLGIHLAGGAYLPIDPELPAERQRFLLEHGQARVALTQSSVRGRLSVPASVEVSDVDHLQPADAEATIADRRRQKPEDLAYVIYTSGSTGVPKGVMIDHRGALNTVLDINMRLGIGSDDRVLALSRLSFDLSVYDVFGLLAAGGTIVMPAADLAYDASHWAEMILAERVTLWNTVPALMQLLVEQAGTPQLLGESLRLVMMSGDWIPLGLPDQIRRVLPKANVISLGGATEASVWSILYPIGKVDPGWKSIPYGKAMRNQSFHVMKRDFAPCPTWVPGQLYIGGVGLANGYLHDKQKTDDSFVVNPATGERLYRTGDLGRFLPDGNIEFLGREDFQVKVQGYRIELGEIEARLQECAGVDLCIAVVREDTPGEKRLVVYVVPKAGMAVDPVKMKEQLRAKLPEYMVPVSILALERFPLTPNGKVDRRALPAPTRAAPETGSVPTRDALDLQLIKLWERILDVRPVGLRDNFFDLGGNSLVAVRLFSEMRKMFGRAFPLSVLFQAPTVEKLADLVRKGGWKSHWSSLVPIQPGGTKPTFFCVHGGGGNILIYRELSRHLGADYPFYGLQARGLDNNSEYLTTTEAMAESYLREMRELQPTGPYYLGGFCMGGQVALEMAQRLTHEGEQVNLVFMIDSHNFNGFPAHPTLAEKLKLALRREIEHLRIRTVHLFHFTPHRDVTGTKEEFIERINDRAYLDYVPGVYPGQVTLCKPRRKYGFLSDRLNGWAGLAAGGLEVVELPTDQRRIFIRPFVGVLAEILRKRLDHPSPVQGELTEGKLNTRFVGNFLGERVQPGLGSSIRRA